MRRSAATLFLTAALAACGGGGGGNPDARPRADAHIYDAAPKSYCFDQTDTDCGYTPSDLTPAEMSLADQLALAKRFNPAQVMTGDDAWAISVNYALVNATDGLHRVEHDGRINFTYDVDMTTDEKVTMYPDGTTPLPADLTQVNLRDLPTTAPSGRDYAYWVDVPGDNTGMGAADETWSENFRSIQGYANPGEGDPTSAPFPPTQYAHLFWLSKADSLLAVSYWFYYPYDKFANSHEGDWEHINVILDVEDMANPVLAFFHLSWHGKQLGLLPKDVYRIADDGDGDHIVIFTGGQTCVKYNDTWCGNESGASWPYPGTYIHTATETVKGDTASPGRRINASDFAIVLIPRPEDMDFSATPELSWYQFEFLAGQPIVAINDLLVQSTKNDRAPVGPGPDHGEFGKGIEETFDILRDATVLPFDPPGDWTLINDPMP